MKLICVDHMDIMTQIQTDVFAQMIYTQDYYVSRIYVRMVVRLTNRDHAVSVDHNTLEINVSIASVDCLVVSCLIPRNAFAAVFGRTILLTLTIAHSVDAVYSEIRI